MSLVLVVLAVALVLGWARGGSLDRLGALPLRSRRLVVGSLAAQLVGTFVGGPFYPLGLAVSAALVVAFLVRNRGIRGTGLVALGLVANAMVVVANGAMPVSLEAAGRAGIGTQDLLTRSDPRHETADRDTRLPWLADVVPVPLPLRPEVVSPGDVLVAAGLGQLVALGMAGAGATDRAPRPPGAAQGRPRGTPPPLPGSLSGATSTTPRRAPSSPRTARPRRPSAGRSGSPS